MSVLRAFKNNWKKTVFALAVSGYAVNEFKTRIQIFQYMTLLSNELQNSSSLSTNSPKRVLVVLNPIANKRKSERNFKKYCEPLLHLAGYEVEIFRTNHIGHAKSFIEENTNLPDVVVVAGGEGTTSEVVTGLMRRSGHLCPLTLLPLGQKSESGSIKFAITGKNDLDCVKSITSALWPLLKNQFEYKSVIQCDVLSNYDNTNEQSAHRLKPIFGLNRFSWGILKNIDSLKDKYWYFGPLRHYVAALLTSTSYKSNWSFEIAYEYTPPCPGCRNCAVLNRPVGPTPAVIGSGPFFIRKLVTPKIEPWSQKSSTKQIQNNNCSTQIKGKIEANDLTIACSRNKENFVELESKFIKSLHPGWDFIKNIPNISISNIQPSLVLKSRTIQLYPSSLKTSLLYSIDGEEYDPRPIKISVVPNAIKVFC
ncbi:acylglycerol kinase, mitochondrial [Drosophila tropicalis]|uniref:acylglycerol kinase, mitochondrial n=1 Tax=Drosophila tropicalis TaxID=46794 RepID=UPI0035AC047A